jgi:filamentous hemagglutinin family protein
MVCPSRPLVRSARLRAVLLVSSSVLFSALLSLSQAQVTLDGSLGPQRSLTGPDYRIDAAVGQIRGRNLFHSFGQLNLSQGESATFTGPNTITNILGRVTGGSPSTIDGTLSSQIPGANLYLFNPSGIVLGANARLDLSGAFHASTADVIRLADGGAFFANPAAPSVLTVAPPAAFGFLGPAPATIMVQGSTLEARPGQSLSLIGGDVEVTGGTLITRSGRLTLVSLGGPGEVPFDHAIQAPALPLESGTRLGTLSLARGATLFAGGNPGGTIAIRGGRLVMTEHATILANAAGSTDGGNRAIDVQVAEDVVLDGSSIFAGNPSAGRARDVAITAGHALTITNEGSIGTRNEGSTGGNIHIDVGRLTLTGGSGITSDTGQDGTGQGGAITVRARDEVIIAGVSASNPDVVVSRLQASSINGRTGNITVSAPSVVLAGGAIATQVGREGGAIALQDVGRLHVTAQGFIESFALSGGQAGGVTITATDAVTLTDGGRISSVAQAGGTQGPTVVKAPTLHIAGGTLGALAQGNQAVADITVEVDTLSLTAGGLIVSGNGTAGAGAGGTITITARASIMISGRSHEVPSTIGNLTVGSGNAGRVLVSTPTLIIDGGFIIADTSGPGSAGDVVLKDIGTLTLTNGASVSSSALTASAGSAGNITLEVGTVSVMSGSFISTNNRGPGKGGAITINAREAVTIAGPTGSSENSNISAGTTGSGVGGQIRITAPVLRMDGGLITVIATEQATDRAGNIAVEVDRLSLSGGAQILSGTLGPAQGGNLTVVARDTLTLAGEGQGFPTGLLASAQPGSGGNAGDIRVEAGSLTLTGGAAISSTTSGTGKGGMVRVAVAGPLTLSGTSPDGTLASTIDATTRGTGEASGDGGAVLVEARTVRIADGAQIRSNTRGPGQGGTVTVTTADALIMTGRDSSLRTTAASSGKGGDITVAAHQVQLTEGAAISAASAGTGDAGSILIAVRDTLLSQRSAVTAAASEATGGNIQITAGSLVRLQDSQLTATVGGGVGNGGNVTIDSAFIVVQGSHITANADKGNGGRLSLTASKALLLDPSSVITATSVQGLQGEVNLQAPVTDISGAVAPLPQTFAQTPELLRSRCAERWREGTVSRFVLGGRDGVPLEPGSLLLSPLQRVDQERSGQAGQRPPQTPALQPAWVSSVQAYAREGGQDECARWMSQPELSRVPKRHR